MVFNEGDRVFSLDKGLGRIFLKSFDKPKSLYHTDLQLEKGDITKDLVKRLPPILPQRKPPKLVVGFDSNNESPRPINEAGPLKVVDRTFRIGQWVTRGSLIGEIMSIDKIYTVKRYGTNDLLQNVKLENIQPISSIFCGVNVELNGWIGQIKSLKRQVHANYTNGPAFRFEYSEPIAAHKKSTTPKSMVSFISKPKYLTKMLGSGYPFLPILGVPFLGPNFFSKTFLKSSAIQWEGVPSNLRNPRLLDRKSVAAYYSGKLCCVHSIEICQVEVHWTRKLSDLSNIKPPALINKNDINKLRSLYIHPASYFEKGGLAMYSVQDGDVYIDQDQWDKGLFNFNWNKCSKSEKISTTHEASPKGPHIVVTKKFSYNLYQVSWHTQIYKEFVPGCYLEPKQDEEYSLCLRFSYMCQYVIRRSPVSPTNEYGVVAKHLNKGFLLILWLQEINGTIEIMSKSGTSVEEAKDLLTHPRYCDLRNGSIVSSSQIPWGQMKVIGTIVNVYGSKLGKVAVYCAIEKTVKLLWPFELNVVHLSNVVNKNLQ